eukprot:TRINITY_DN4123_c0_g1_i1.p1 TRINITY_DN4123_c0_g1~~TRINITY_DN4123_c0_g1_i1.p1  ORF type:complete len:369 (-),score=90.30 TRINITY_DN4123_c0_g1_i1:128-1195(-)
MLEGLELTEEDKKFITLCQENKEKVTPPIYSNFRVYAIITYLDEEGSLKYVHGANCESCFIGGSICAERSAIVKFKEIKYQKILKLYLVSDGDDYITPGILCRLFLLEFVSPQAPVIMIGAKSSKISDLATLYPYPPHYIGVNASKVLECAKNFSLKTEKLKTKFHKEGSHQHGVNGEHHLMSLYHSVIKATARDNKDTLFPLRWAAGLLVEDKETRTILLRKIVWQDKTLEYGSTIDPITKLLPFLQEFLLNWEKEEQKKLKANPSATPSAASTSSTSPLPSSLSFYLIQSDQFGVLHSPVAQARALYFENNFEGILIFVHDKDGKLKETNFKELLPDSPKVDAFLDKIRESWN